MGYVCANDGMDFPTRRELIEHMHDKYGCTFIEGDFAPLAEKLLKAKTDNKSKELVAKHAYSRGD